MKTVMLHMKMPDDLAEACEGKDLKAEVSAALRTRWFAEDFEHDALHLGKVPVDPVYPTYGSIPAEQKLV